MADQTTDGEGRATRDPLIVFVAAGGVVATWWLARRQAPDPLVAALVTVILLLAWTFAVCASPRRRGWLPIVAAFLVAGLALGARVLLIVRTDRLWPDVPGVDALTALLLGGLAVGFFGTTLRVIFAPEVAVAPRAGVGR